MYWRPGVVESVAGVLGDALRIGQVGVEVRFLCGSGRGGWLWPAREVGGANPPTW